MKHAPLSAARAVAALEHDNIAVTWDQYFAQQRELEHVAPSQRAFSGRWLNAYKAALLVQEQCGFCTFREASRACEEVMPSLFAEYWSELPAEWESLERTVQGV